MNHTLESGTTQVDDDPTHSTIANFQVQGRAGLLHVNDGGKGEVPVVFVHSFAGSTHHWTPQLDHLRQTRRALALDLRGHGLSQASASTDNAIASLSDDIAAVADALHITQFVLVGHGLGAAAALIYAGMQPGRVAGLVLVGPPGTLPPDEAGKIIAALASDFRKTMDGYWQQLTAGAQPKVLQRLLKDKRNMSKSSTLSFIHAVFEYDPLPSLASYPGPTLIVTSVPDEQPNALHHVVQGVPHRAVTGTSHWVQMDKPHRFNRLLDEFLANL